VVTNALFRIQVGTSAEALLCCLCNVLLESASLLIELRDSQTHMSAFRPNTRACRRRFGLRHWRLLPLRLEAAAQKPPSLLQSAAARR
jgi:hypothetical protein